MSRNIMNPGDVFTCIENVYEQKKVVYDSPQAPEWVDSDVILYTKGNDYIVTECICLTDNFNEPRDWIYPYKNYDYGWSIITCECCGHDSYKSEPRKFFRKHFIAKI